MKRSRMPDRAAPMKRGGFARTPPTPLEYGVTPRPYSSGPTKARRRNTGPPEAVKDIVRTRAKGRCELCGGGVAFGIAWVMDIHHRRPRAAGGTKDPAANQASNLVLLHRHCHEDLVESHRTWALAAGWLVLQGHDPALACVQIVGRAATWLSNDGQYRDTPPALSDYQPKGA